VEGNVHTDKIADNIRRDDVEFTIVEMVDRIVSLRINLLGFSRYSKYEYSERRLQ